MLRRLRSMITWKRLLISWIIVFTVVVMYSLRETRNTASQADTTAQKAENASIQAKKAAAAATVAAKAGRDAKKSLCAFLDDVSARIIDTNRSIQQTREFLKENPGPILLGGIRRSVIEAQLVSLINTRNGLKKTRASLSKDSNCP